MNFIYGLKVIDFISRLIKIYYDNLATVFFFTVFFFKNNKSDDTLFHYEKEDKGI